MKITLATITAITLPASLALAVTTTYTDRALYTLDAGLSQVENFESEDLGQFAMPTTFSSGLSADLFNGSVSSLIEAGDPDEYGFQNTTDDGRKYLRMGQRPIGGADETGSYTIQFTTDSAVNSFGFNISGFQPGVGANGFNLTLMNDAQIVDDLFIPSDLSATEVGFFGFINAQGDFNTIRINIPVISNQTADYVAFDDVTWATIPAPSTASLLALTTLLATRRRR